MSSPFQGFEPLQPAALREQVFAVFGLTFAVQALVIAGAILKRVRRRRVAALPETHWRLPRRPDLLVGRSWAERGLWSLPLLLWAFQATLSNGSAISFASGGLISPPIGFEVHFLFYNLLILGIVVTVQTLATLVLTPRGPLLGLTPRYRTVVVLALLTVFLDTALYLRMAHGS